MLVVLIARGTHRVTAVLQIVAIVLRVVPTVLRIVAVIMRMVAATVVQTTLRILTAVRAMATTVAVIAAVVSVIVQTIVATGRILAIAIARRVQCSGGNSKGSGINRLETSDEEQQKFYCTLNDASIKPAILRIVLPFAETLAPKVTLPDYPKPITELYNPSAQLLTYPELLTECERVYAYDFYKVC